MGEFALGFREGSLVDQWGLVVSFSCVISIKANRLKDSTGLVCFFDIRDEQKKLLPSYLKGYYI